MSRCLYGNTLKISMLIAHASTLTGRQRTGYTEAMRRTPKHAAPEGFIQLLQQLMERRNISLNHLAERAGMSPAFLSRILNRKRGLPSDKTILRLAEQLDLRPRERLLIEAGRIPDKMKAQLSAEQVLPLLRAVGQLSETDRQAVLKTAESLVLKQQQGRKRP